MKKGRSNQAFFAQTPAVQMPRSSFNRTYNGKTTFDAGNLIPIMVDKVVPGDTYNVRLHALARLATAQKPVMDDIFLNTFFFFVPNRLVWDKWEQFMGERKPDPDSSIDYLIPQTSAPDGVGYAVHSIFDYMGLPVGIENLSHSVLPMRGYNLIFNEFFRDENLQDSLPVNKDQDGPDLYTDYVIKRRNKARDYFTSSLPWPQKADSVLIPGSDYLPVHGLAMSVGASDYVGTATGTRDSSGTNAIPTGSDWDTVVADQLLVQGDNAQTGGRAPRIHVDLTENTDGTINALRMAEQLQVFYERDARGGTRFIELLKSQYGVTSPDFRLQRPEYLGGGSSRVNVSPISQTAATGATGTPQGNLAAMGVCTVKGHGFTHSFVEHGYIIGLISCQANISYQNGIERTWLTRTREEEYFPAFANLGEQATLKGEIYATGTETDDDVWGYNERYSEYRYKPSLITGLMRSDVSGSLDVWHLAQDFDSAPGLNSDFIEDNPPIDRVIAVPTEPHFIIDYVVGMTTARVMPTHPLPGNASRF